MTRRGRLFGCALLAGAIALAAQDGEPATSKPVPSNPGTSPSPPPVPFFLSPQIPQPPPPPGKADFSTDVDMVLLDVSVRDSKGGFVGGLKRGDFQIFENGRPQPIQTFNTEDAPVTVGILVDSSRSMRSKRREVITAAESFVKISNPRDEIFVINFDDKISFGLPVGTPFACQIPDLRDALMSSPLDGRTALYDAVLAGLAHASEGKNLKKVLLLVTDGGDNQSTHSFDEVLAAAQKSNATIYVIGFFDVADQDQNPGMLRRLAKETGGSFYQPRQVNDIVELAEQVARDIRARYTLGYIPALNGASRYRTLKVMASAPGHGRLRVKTREGYLAPGAPAEAANTGLRGSVR
ncbi:MAG: VWA domain-containing protein [Bryobacterales bacterium]|nr:VWA domain-containing protein [Bryobacterales bacterium]